jgi:hypothetical protein
MNGYFEWKLEPADRWARLDLDLKVLVDFPIRTKIT